MPVSALAERGAPQQIAGAAFDVFMETIRQAAVLKWFHKDRTDSVRKLAGTELEWSEVEPWSIYGASIGFDASDDNVSGGIEGLRLNAIAIWPENSVLFPNSGATGIAEANIVDLAYMFRLALIGGRDAASNLEPGNPTLLWRDNNDADFLDWPDLPTGFGGQLNVQTAAHGIERGPLAVNFGRQEVSLSGAEPCMMAAMEFSTVYGVVRTTC